jgi:hypothetical protein
VFGDERFAVQKALAEAPHFDNRLPVLIALAQPFDQIIGGFTRFKGKPKHVTVVVLAGVEDLFGAGLLATATVNLGLSPNKIRTRGARRNLSLICAKPSGLK